MFTCNACLRRAFASFVNHPRPYRTPATLRPFYTRRHRTAYAEAVAPVEITRQDETPTDQKSPKVSKSREWAALKQLQYLKDPLHIAAYVKKTLENDNFEEAALITRKASKNTKVAVSWNFLIDYQLQRDKLHAAIKLYNEMKKRAQLPNAQTFTIIFRGLARSAHPKLAVSEATRIYNTMLASTSRIRPNTIHMNAILQVCAKAEDIDSMFTIAETANDGLRAPNSLTYTIILNALRSEVDKPSYETLKDLEVEKNKAQAIQRARAVWEEVTSKWRAGSIVIDEELVCAMGRILLIGGYHDADSVEALLEQTMMISQDEKAKALQPPKEAEDDGPNTDITPPAKVDSQKIKAPGSAISHALPGNNSLSMILLALEKTGKTTKAQRYWDIFTKQHGVIPDADNWHRLLTTLCRGKNAFQTVSCLRKIPSKLMVPKNFRIAIRTCLRDNLNRSAFHHATQVLEIMLSNLQIPDMIVLRTYLRIAYANKRYFSETMKSEEAAKMAWGKQLLTALENLQRPFMLMAKHCENDGPEANSMQELIALARRMIATYDRLIFSNMVTPEAERWIKPARNNLNKTVVRHFELMAEIDPKYRPKDEKGEDGEDEEDFAGRFQQRRGVSEKRPAEKHRAAESW
ncbi:hypothetical protein F4818DRAFT_209259 [Hypoxylon cercidicola]|nr:hypothetical protein F4818DRAFT_209259 [Hypoxylon cercidicola]